jgi:hypothetical protein
LDIAAWLSELGLERYVEAFEANDVDAAVLRTLNADDLKELGVTSLGHRKKLLEAIAALTPQSTAAPVADAPEPASATPIPRPEAERRQLTVMFVDLVVVGGAFGAARSSGPADSDAAAPGCLRWRDRPLRRSCGEIPARRRARLVRLAADPRGLCRAAN